MKNRVIVFLLSFLITGMVSAQQANYWMFGTYAGLNFNGGAPVKQTGAPIKIRTMEGSSAISGTSGNLIMYTDGLTVWDGNHISRYTSLLGGESSAQSALIIPFPGSLSKFYIFTASIDPTSGGLGTQSGINYVTVDTVGWVFSAATNLNPIATASEQITAASDGAGGFWIISHMNTNNTGLGDNRIVTWHFSAAGTMDNGPVYSSVATGTKMIKWIGSAKINTCQNQVAFTFLDQGAVELYDFDNSAPGTTTNSGKITALKKQIPLGTAYGLEFSPNDAYLYYTSLSGNKLYQYDIANDAIYTQASWVNSNEISELGQLQAAPDGKIYVATPANGGQATIYLGAITSPNTVGAGAAYNGQAITLSTTSGTDGKVYRGLPTFYKSMVLSTVTVLPGNGTYCVNTNIPLSYTFGGAVDHVLWSVAAPAVQGTHYTYTTGNASSNSPTINFSQAGTYTVGVTVTDLCGRTYSKSMTLTIVTPLAPSGTLTCNGTYITMAANPADPDKNKYVWYTGPAPATTTYGTGASVNWYSPNEATAPTTVYAEIAASATTTTIGSGVDGTPAGWLRGAGFEYFTKFNILAPRANLNSFQMTPASWGAGGGCAGSPTVSFNITITNSSGTVVYTSAYSSAITCDVALTVPVNVSLFQGNNYTLTLSSWTTPVPVWLQVDANTYPGTLAGVATTTGPATSGTYTVIGNLNYTGYSTSYTTTCSNRVPITRVCTLPVEWNSFTVSNVNGRAQLLWSTLTETNNDRFEIERSIDGINFSSIGLRTGKGNSSRISLYDYTDSEGLNGVVYYRIKQVDIDGQYTYSPTRSIDLSSSVLAVVYPNPSTADFNLQSNAEETLLYTVYDITGRVVLNGSVNGFTTFGALLTPGAYFVKIQSEAEVQTVKLIKE